MMLFTALLAAMAAGVAVASPVRPDRLSDVVRSGRGLGSGPPGPAGPLDARRVTGRRRARSTSGASGLPPWVRHGASGMAGLAVWWVVGGLVGVVLGLSATVAGPRLLGRLDDTEGDDRDVAAQLPLALDLLAACLIGGATTPDAVRAVAAAVPGACGARLARVGAALAVGTPTGEAWRAFGDGPGPAGAVARALTRAAVGGAPVAVAVLRVAEDARRASTARAERAARRAGVLAVGPLGICFLPAFLLLGVVPAVVGLATPLLASF